MQRELEKAYALCRRKVKCSTTIKIEVGQRAEFGTRYRFRRI